MSLYEWLPHYHFPTTKTPELLRRRNAVGARWGAIATLTVWALLMVIPVVNWLYKRGYRIAQRPPLLPKVTRWLTQLQSPSAASAPLAALLALLAPQWAPQYTEYLALLDSQPVPRRRRSRIIRWWNHLIDGLKEFSYWMALRWNSIARIGFWAALLTFFAVIETNNDYVWLAKRLGRIPAICMPPILFLTLRPLPLPHTLYLAVLPIHKWMARLIVVQAVVHTIIYLFYFQFKNGLFHKAWKRENLYGWVALFGFLVITVTLLGQMRNRYYRLFYINHYLWTWVIVAMLQVHIRPWNYKWYTAANVAILIWQIAARVYMLVYSTTRSQIGFVEVKQALPLFTVVQFPKQFLAVPHKNPGAHLRLTLLPKQWWRRWWRLAVPMYHPYTLALLPNDKTQLLIIRELTFRLVNDGDYVICATYDPKLLFITRDTHHQKTKKPAKFQILRLHINAKRMLIVIGGLAVLFALPLIRVATYHGIPVKVVWVVRDFRDVQVLKHYEDVVSGDDFEIYVTGEPLLSRRRLFYFDRDLADAVVDDTDPYLRKWFDSHDDDVYENVEVDVALAPASDSGTVRAPLPALCGSLVVATTPTSAPVPPAPRRIRKKPLMNDPFEVYYSKLSSEHSKNYVVQYRETVESLGISHRVYKGRPVMDHRYVDWCINEGFTQCSGPVADENNNLVCCQAVQPNRVRQTNVNCRDVWVVLAGPGGLVNNMKLWATQNGFNFHEEAFNV